MNLAESSRQNYRTVECFMLEKTSGYQGQNLSQWHPSSCNTRELWLRGVCTCVWQPFWAASVAASPGHGGQPRSFWLCTSAGQGRRCSQASSSCKHGATKQSRRYLTHRSWSWLCGLLGNCAGQSHCDHRLFNQSAVFNIFSLTNGIAPSFLTQGQILAELQCSPGGIAKQQEQGLVQSLQICAHVAAQRAPKQSIWASLLLLFTIRPFFLLR